jgi:hypothetical protein
MSQRREARHLFMTIASRGAAGQHSTWGSGLTLTATGVIFDPKGSIRFKASSKFVPGSGGTIGYRGTVTATGGTGVPSL